MRYALTNADGSLIGFLDDKLNTIPAGAMTLTDEEHDRWLSNKDGFKILDGKFVEIPEPVTVRPPPIFTSLDFMGLFTASEQHAIADAARTNTQLFLWFMSAMGAASISLGDPRTLGGIEALAAAGLLSPERKAQVLVGKPPATAA